MALVTGGEVKELVISPQQGGHVLSRGGSRFLILSAGYLGSMAWGALIFLLAVKTRWDQWVMILLGIMILTIAVLFARNIFGLGFSLAAGTLMIFSGIKLSEAINDFLLKLIGLTSMIYVPQDIYGDTIARSYLRSDAYMLAEETFGTAFMWGCVWILASILLIIFCLSLSINKKA